MTRRETASGTEPRALLREAPKGVSKGVAALEPDLDQSASARMPVGFRLVREGDHTELVLSSRPKALGFLTFFAGFWNTFMVVWYAIAIGQGEVTMMLFGLLHAAVGAGLGYACAVGWLNKKRLVLDGETLAVRHGPVPVPTPKPIHRADIDQLWVQLDTSVEVNDVPVEQYQLMLRTKGDKDIKLFGGIPKRDQALYLEQELEAALGIVDRKLRGEIPRNPLPSGTGPRRDDEGT